MNLCSLNVCLFYKEAMIIGMIEKIVIHLYLLALIVKKCIIIIIFIILFIIATTNGNR